MHNNYREINSMNKYIVFEILLNQGYTLTFLLKFTCI